MPISKFDFFLFIYVNDNNNHLITPTETQNIGSRQGKFISISPFNDNVIQGTVQRERGMYKKNSEVIEKEKQSNNPVAYTKERTVM